MTIRRLPLPWTVVLAVVFGLPLMVQGATPLDRKVSLHPPYPKNYDGARDDRITLEYAAFELAKQALAGYNFGESRRRAGKTCDREVTPNLRKLPLRQALDRLLKPAGLTYVFERGEVTLTLAAAASADARLEQIVSLRPPYRGVPRDPKKYDRKKQRVTVHAAMAELAKQAGLGYNAQASYKNTDPVCGKWIQPVVDRTTLAKALDKVLAPLGMSYTIVEDKVVLNLKTTEPAEEILKKKVKLLAPYPVRKRGDRADSITLLRAVEELLRDTGLTLDVDGSTAASGSAGRKRIVPEIRGAALSDALKSLLTPANLTYEIEHGVLVVKAPDVDKSKEMLKRRVTLTPPYPSRRGTMSLQGAVAELTRQARLRYEWNLSRDNIGRLTRAPVKPTIRNQPVGKALQGLLRPFKLRFELRDETIVLIPAKGGTISKRLDLPVTLRKPYPVDSKRDANYKIRLDKAMNDLCRQTGMVFDWKASRKNVGSTIWRYIYPNVKNRSLRKALPDILDPVGLAYAIEDNKLVLIKK